MIEKYLKKGKHNAITRGRLCRLTGMSDRSIRREIAELRERIPIVNLQDGKGYFIATENELIDIQIALDKSRVETLSKRIRNYQNFKSNKQMEIEGIYSV